MNYHYLFQDIVKNQQYNHKLIIVRHSSKYKYKLKLYKKRVDQIPDINNLKLGCFLYLKNNKYCIYDAKNYLIKQFNEHAEFLVEKEYHMDIGNALIELFNKS